MLVISKQAFNLSKRRGFKEVIAASYRLYGMNFGYQKKWADSIKNFNKSIELFDDMGFKVELRRSYLDYGLMLKAKGDTATRTTLVSKPTTSLHPIK